MRAADPKIIVAEYIEKVWNKADLAAFGELTTASFAYHLGGQRPRGTAAARQFLQAVHAAFPDWRIQVQEIIAAGGIVAVRWSGTVTHQGVFNGIPPTGKRIAVCGINMYLVENGRITREWEQMDSLGMLQQLGVLPAPR